MTRLKPRNKRHPEEGGVFPRVAHSNKDRSTTARLSLKAASVWQTRMFIHSLHLGRLGVTRVVLLSRPYLREGEREKDSDSSSNLEVAKYENE